MLGLGDDLEQLNIVLQPISGILSLPLFQLYGSFVVGEVGAFKRHLVSFYFSVYFFKIFIQTC